MAAKWKHYSARTIDKARAAVAEDKTTFNGLRQRLERDFHVRPAVSTTYEWFHTAADSINMERDYEQWAAEGFSGVLAIDELYDGFVVLVATDPINNRTISVQLCNDASEASLLPFLEHIKSLGIEPRVIVTDGALIYQRVPQRVWPQARHQLCVFHYTKRLTEHVLDAVSGMTRYLRKIGERKDALDLMRARYAFTTRPENLSEFQRATLKRLGAKYSTLQVIRDFMVKAFAAMEPGQTRQSALAKHYALVQNPVYRNSKGLLRAIRTLRPEMFMRTLTFLDYTNCPRTTNHVERANRYYRKRAKSHYRNRTRRAIWNMVKSDLMVRKARHFQVPTQLH